MKKLRILLKPYLINLAFGSILGGLSLAAAVGLLASSAWLISMASTRPPILVLEVAIVGVRFFGLSRGLFRYAGRIVEHDAALQIQTSLRISVYEKLAKFLPQHFSAIRRGNLLSQILNDVEIIQDLWLRVLAPWASALFSGACGIGIMYWLLPPAANAISLLFIAAAFLVPFVSVLGANSQTQRANQSELFSQVIQITESANEALIFNFEESLLQNLTEMQSKISAIELSNAKRSGFASALHLIFLGGATSTALYYAANGFAHHNLAGVNVAVIALLPLVIFEGIASLPVAFAGFRAIIEAILNLEPYLSDSPAGNDFKSQLPLTNSVVLKFNDVTPIIPGVLTHSISGEVKPGQTLIIMGKSGSGKSSIINSLLGFLPFTGTIEINGEKLAQKHESLLTTLLQDDYLFATSIRENLNIGRPEASEKELLEVLETVELAELIHSLPDGLDTHVGPLGYNFSGGEKQRMKLARLLLRNTPVVILDEPFEYLDPLQMNRIALRVSEKLKTKTVLIVSHLELQIPAKIITLAFSGAPRQD